MVCHDYTASGIRDFLFCLHAPAGSHSHGGASRQSADERCAARAVDKNGGHTDSKTGKYHYHSQPKPDPKPEKGKSKAKAKDEKDKPKPKK